MIKLKVLMLLAAGGLAGLVRACLCLDEQVLPGLRSLEGPRAPLPWLRNRSDGPRSVCSQWISPETFPSAPMAAPEHSSTISPLPSSMIQ